MVTSADGSGSTLLDAGYGRLLEVVSSLAPGDLARRTRASDWNVGDLLFHLLLDAQRVLVTMASPTEAAADTDAISYWRQFPPARPGAADHAGFVRRSFLAYAQPSAVVDQLMTTLPAAIRAAGHGDPAAHVATQGHVLTVADFRSTVVVEATVHHLDLIVDLPDAVGPDVAALTETRRVLTGLLGAPFPPLWSDTDVVLRATGREPSGDRRLPLIQ